MTFFKRAKNTCLRHQYQDQKAQLAVWSKRSCLDDALYFRGTLRECVRCGVKRFRPDDPKLREVEVA